MKTGFYPRLAIGGIRKNKRMYLPYILTCIGMVMMYYIMVFLETCDALPLIRGTELLRATLGFGGWVIAIFACIFLFYTNSFLLRRRKKEFGLYNILGMGKRNIARILFWESLIVALFSLLAGLFFGIAFSKLAELCLLHIMEYDVNYTLSVSVTAIRMTLIVFGVIFSLLFLNSLRQVRFSGVMALLRSENTGEKPPRGNLFFGILGALILGAAYYMAVKIENPVAALEFFFIAVILVIIGTYILMIAGSVALCRFLQRRKKYYYKANHFVSVSSMAYRMKRNGAGLASICILATMVLVMISSTASLYFGGEDSLYRRYPREIDLTFYLEDTADLSEENGAALRGDVLHFAESYGVTPQNFYSYRRVAIAGYLEDGVVETDVTKANGMGTLTDVWQFYFVSLSDYNAMTNKNERLAAGEALIYTYRSDYSADTIAFNLGNTFKIKKQVYDFIGDGDTAMALLPSMVIIVPDLAEGIRGLDTLADYNGNRMITMRFICNFDTGENEDIQAELLHGIRDSLHSHRTGTYGPLSADSRAMERDSFFSLFGGLFFLGILLSIVFLFAAVLIIYYKQISEGYEDQSRFEIMQKVGMTKREIRKSINSQLLCVFFLPLALAALHLAFAFPIIEKLLRLFNLNNITLFAGVTAGSIVVFALFYTLVYRATSNAYFGIVSGGKKKI